MYTLSLEIVNKCNLNCSYCYLGEKKNTFMTFDTAKKAVDIAAHETKKQYDKLLVVYFIGGEPLLAFDLIKQIVNYTKYKCGEYGLRFIFSTTINGTLLTEKITDFLIENRFELKVSIDGPEYVHNLNRKTYSHEGSFESIMRNWTLLKKYEQETGNYISIAHVVTENNYHYLSDSFNYFLTLNCKKIETGIDHYCDWPESELEQLKENIEDVFYIYKEYMQKNKSGIFWNLFEQYIKSYIFGCPFYACRAGLNNVYIATSGEIFTCIELPEFHIGSVFDGLNVPRIREIAYAEDRISDECQDCKYIKMCKTRSCQASNFEINKNIYKPVHINCFVTKTMFELFEKNITQKQIEYIKQAYKGDSKYGNK